jgi:hypothetical protein
VLERLKTPVGERKKRTGKLKKEFNEENYGEMWAYYVRELATHPSLGDLRSSFLDRLK